MPSKTIVIHRHYGFVHGANPDPEAKEYFDMSYKAVGSYYKVFGKVYASGLTREEENIVMPELTGFYPQDKKEFRESVNKYFRNINTKIPPEGLTLEIGLEKDGPLSEDNMPLRPDEYVAYKHAIGHPQVCESKDQAERMGALAEFYVLDKVEETKSKTKTNRLEDDAAMYYFKVRDDEFKVEQLLTIMGISVRNLDSEERVIKLKELSTIDTDQSDAANRTRLEKFITSASDKDMGIKYDILEMIRINILERVKFKILDRDTGEVIGDNLKEAVLWFKDKKNSKDVNVYYARLTELGKSSRDEIATQEPEPVVSEPVEMSDSAMSDFEDDTTKK